MVLIKDIDYKQQYLFPHNKDFYYLIMGKYLNLVVEHRYKYYKVLKFWFNGKKLYCDDELFTIKQIHKLKPMKYNNIKIFKFSEYRQLNNLLKKQGIISYLNYNEVTNCFECYYNTIKDINMRSVI